MILKIEHLFAMESMPARMRFIYATRSFFLICTLAVAVAYSYADVTINVVSGSTSTCLGSLYSRILVPEWWGSSSDTNLATTYARSDVGVLGITLFLEVRPNSLWPSPGNDAMKAITYSFLNVNRATNITPSNYSTFKSQIKYQSSAWVRQS